MCVLPKLCAPIKDDLHRVDMGRSLAKSTGVEDMHSPAKASTPDQNNVFCRVTMNSAQTKWRTKEWIRK